MLNVNKSITLNGTSSVEENGAVTDIMYMNATISENGLSINRNIANAQDMCKYVIAVQVIITIVLCL